MLLNSAVIGAQVHNLLKQKMNDPTVIDEQIVPDILNELHLVKKCANNANNFTLKLQ